MQSENVNTRLKLWWLPGVVFLCISIGFFGAKWVTEKQSASEMTGFQSQIGTLDIVLDYIQEYYVDTLSKTRLEDKALAALLRQLDPHSEYIPPSHFNLVNEPLEGNFEGIGVEYNILHDTVRVMRVIPGGPSENAGLQNGDRILQADSIHLTGPSVNNEKVLKSLRGKGGTKVRVKVLRSGEKQPLVFLITRGKIPIHSLEAAFMLNSEVGYIRFRQFSATTPDEFRDAMNRLSSRGMKKMILDLRGNGGGFLNAAVEMADEFLPKGMRIVYTEGRKYPKKEYFSTEYGSFENKPLLVLVDENSASASEIVAGALQDNDRALIVGRRTFGKGLVQDQIPLQNGGALRLTVARYYTPVGRCIQKPYNNEDLYSYFLEEYQRFDEGELFHRDSIKTDTTKPYFTPSGKKVYGGGGIVPDIFLPLDTSRFHSSVNRWYRTGRIQQFCYDEADAKRVAWKAKYPTPNVFIEKFLVDRDLLERWFERLGPEERKLASHPRIILDLKKILHAQLGRVLWGDDAFYPLWIQNDSDVQKALEIMDKTS